MSVFLRHDPCERCGSSDAKAIYSNGGTYCFSCGTSGRGQFVPSVVFTEDAASEHICLPPSFEQSFPSQVESFLARTGITLQELYENNYVFSSGYYGQDVPRLGRIFVSLRNLHRDEPLLWHSDRGRVQGALRVCGYETKVVALPSKEARPVSKSVPPFLGSGKASTKSVFRGPKADISGASSARCGVQSETSCVLVEDSLSAIKVGRQAASYTLFGSTVDNTKLSWLVKPYKKIYIWLDSDKYNYAKLLAERIKWMGKESCVIHTDVDPKYVDDFNIRKLLNVAI